MIRLQAEGLVLKGQSKMQRKNRRAGRKGVVVADISERRAMQRSTRRPPARAHADQRCREGASGKVLIEETFRRARARCEEDGALLHPRVVHAISSSELTLEAATTGDGRKDEWVPCRINLDAVSDAAEKNKITVEKTVHYIARVRRAWHGCCERQRAKMHGLQRWRVSKRSRAYIMQAVHRQGTAHSG